MTAYRLLCCVLILEQNAPVLGQLLQLSGLFLPSNWCMDKPQSTQSVRPLSGSRVAPPQWLASKLLQLWFAILYGVTVECGVVRRAIVKCSWTHNKQKWVKSQKQWAWGASDGGSHVVSWCFNAALAQEHTCTLYIVNAVHTHSTGKGPELQCFAGYTKLPALLEIQSFNCVKQRLLLPS